MKKTTKKVVVACSALAVLGGVLGITSAYFTDNEEKSNVFEVGKVTIDLTEDNWDDTDDNGNGVPDQAENIVPLKTLSKDPKVINTGDNPAWCFISYDVPKQNLVTANATGSKNVAKPTELFIINNIDTENWVKLSETEANGKVTRVYGYKTAVAPGQATTPLFESVQFANFVEGQGLEDTEPTIDVKAMAIQSEESGTMQEAYQKYLNQNQ